MTLRLILTIFGIIEICVFAWMIIDVERSFKKNKRDDDHE